MKEKTKENNSGSVNTKGKTSGGKKDTKVKERKVDIKKTRKTSKFHIPKIYLFAVLNVIALIMSIYLLGTFNQKSNELKELINAQLNAQQSSQVNLADLEIKSNQEKADKIIALFPNDQGLLDFIQIIEDKSKQGTIVNFTFASKEPVRDSTARLGIPVVVNFRGSWQDIDRDLREIQKSPFLFRPITIEASITAEENVVEFMYGGFLYVDDSF